MIIFFEGLVDERAAFQRSAFGQSTAGNDVVATIIISLFCGVAGSERVLASPLGWYLYSIFYDISWHVSYCKKIEYLGPYDISIISYSIKFNC